MTSIGRDLVGFLLYLEPFFIQNRLPPLRELLKTFKMSLAGADEGI
jgi:hypothetical protein